MSSRKSASKLRFEMQRIDFHVHLTPPEIINDVEKIKKLEPYFALLAENPHNRYARAEDVITALGESGFDRAVVFGFAFKDMGLCRMVNDYVIEKVRQFPEQFTGFMSISPHANGVEAEIERCYKAGLRGVGELYPDGQNLDIDDEKQTRTFTNACKELNIPVIVHTNEPVGHFYKGKNDIPLTKIERFIEHSQGLNIILAHWGGGLMFYESMPDLREKFRTVYYDTAATPFLYDAHIYKTAIALNLEHKILFGSDFPLLPPSRYLSQMEGLSLESKNLILGGNAQKLL